MKKLFSMVVGLLSIYLLIGCGGLSNTHTVNFVINNDLEDVSVEVENGETVDQIDVPNEGNHLFLGWYETNDFETPYDFTETVKGDINIYARYSQFEFGKENFITFKENDLFGFMLPTGEVVIEPQYEDASIFRFGYALVIKDEEMLFIDELGNEYNMKTEDTSMFPYRYTMNFTREGKVLIFSDDRYNLLNSDGEILFDIEKNNERMILTGSYFEDGLIPVYFKDSQSGFEGCAYLDEFGDIALSGDYYSCSSFSNGLAAVEITSGDPFTGTYYHGYTFINPSGEVILQTDLTTVYKMFDGIQPVLFKDGYAIGYMGTYLGSGETSSYVVIDEEGNIILDFEVTFDGEYLNYEIPVDVSNGYVLTKNQDDFYAIYDLDGDLIMDYTYKVGSNQDSVIGIYDNRVVFRNDEGQYGAVDVTTGNVVIEFEYDFMSAFNGGYAVVEDDGLYGVIDTDGNIVVDIVYDQMFSVTNNYIYQDIIR